MDSKQKPEIDKKKKAYIKQLKEEQRASVAQNQDQPSSCCGCFGFLGRKKAKKPKKQEKQKENDPQLQFHSKEWILYFMQQLESSEESSSNKVLNFNWARELKVLVQESGEQFAQAQSKLRSALFYENFSAKQFQQIREKSGELDSIIEEQKHRYTEGVQRSVVMERQGSRVSGRDSQRTGELVQIEGIEEEEQKGIMGEDSKEEEVKKEKGLHKKIEDFGNPISQLENSQLQILYQIKTNLVEVDHPVLALIHKFQEVFLAHVQTKKTMLGQKPKKTFALRPEFQIVHNEEGKLVKNPSDIRFTKMRQTYNRPTLNELSEEEKYAEIAISEVKKFVCVLFGTLVRFYMPVVKFQDLHDMREDLIELLTSTTIRGDLSKVLLQLCRVSSKQEEQLLFAKFSQFKKLKPIELGISNLFTLDGSSKLVQLYYEMVQEELGDVGGSGGEQKSIKQRNKSMDADQNQSLKRQHTDEWSDSVHNKLPHHFHDEFHRGVTTGHRGKEGTVISELGISKEELRVRLLIKPYKLAIDNIRKLRQYETPIDKMRCITLTSRYIVKSIDYFWKRVKVLEKSKLTLDADELLMIFIFVTIRSKVTEILSHLKLINEFSTEALRKTKLGFYCSTMEVAAQQVLSLERDHLAKAVAVNFDLRQSIDEGVRAGSLIHENLRNSLQTNFPLEIVDDYHNFGLVQEDGVFRLSQEQC